MLLGRIELIFVERPRARVAQIRRIGVDEGSLRQDVATALQPSHRVVGDDGDRLSLIEVDVGSQPVRGGRIEVDQAVDHGRPLAAKHAGMAGETLDVLGMGGIWAMIASATPLPAFAPG